MLLSIMLYAMLAYLMLFATLSNAVCLLLYLMLFVCIMLFAFMLCIGLLTQFVYFKYDFQSCAVILICWFFIMLCPHHFLYERGMCSLEK